MHMLIWIFSTLLGLSWRVTIIDPHNVAPQKKLAGKRIYCFWHANLLCTSFIFRNTGGTAMVSKSKDGQLAAAVAKLWKHDIIFGSSSRGGSAALRQSIRHVSTGRTIALTPDGPRGPRHVVKPGVAQIAIGSKSPVVALSVTASRFWQLSSWDKFIIPQPFARVTITVSKPMIPDGNDDKDAIEKFRSIIEKELLGDS